MNTHSYYMMIRGIPEVKSSQHRKFWTFGLFLFRLWATTNAQSLQILFCYLNFFLRRILKSEISIIYTNIMQP